MDKAQRDKDQATIFAETAHIRNRDEIMRSGNRIIQGGSSSDIDDGWDSEDRHRLNGISDQSSEAVDTQLQQLDRITKEIRDPADHRQPTQAKPSDSNDPFEKMSDEELMDYADVLGIPDRYKVPRMKLIGLIREQERVRL